MEIYQTRSQIGAKEPCAYVCLQLPDPLYPSWFSLWSKPNQTLTKQIGKMGFKLNPSGNSVVPIPFSSSTHPLPIPDHIVKVGSDIYVIGGYMEPSSSVGIIDCRNHTWREVPNMTVARKNHAVASLHEKIYVMGGCDIDEYSANWIEVFDIKTQSWTALPGPRDDDEEISDQLRHEYCSIMAVFEGKFNVSVGEKNYTYDPKDGTWKVTKEQQLSFLSVEMWCSIENVMYCYTSSWCLMWYKRYNWELREIKGLEKLLEHPTRGLRIGTVQLIMNYGGKLLVMWYQNLVRHHFFGIKMQWT